MDNLSSYQIHPILYREFQEKCKQLKVKNPSHLISALMRNFILEYDNTENNPEILIGSTLVEKKEIAV